MSYRYSRFISIIHIIGDLIALNAAFVLSHLLVDGLTPLASFLAHTELLIFFNVAWLLLNFIFRPYQVGRAEHVIPVLRKHCTLMLFHAILIASHIALTKDYTHFSECIVLTYALFALFEFCWKVGFLTALRKYRKKGFNYRNVVIMGYGELAEDLQDYFGMHPEYGFRLLGIFDNQRSNSKLMGKMDDLVEFVKSNKVDEIYCCLPYVRYRKVKELVDFADENLIKVKLIADFRGFSFKGVELERYDHIPVLNVSTIPLDNTSNQLLKRAFDVVFSSLVIVFILSWLFPIIALMVKLESKGPVLFKQKRSGLKNNAFWCYKFRSMCVNAEADSKQCMKGDARITKVGAFLRKTSLDELPQFFNVLLGNMSVVGPRPHMLRHTEEYSKQINKFMARHFVKPGITGLAQAKGLRGETECMHLMNHRIRLDRFYVSKWSMIFDVRIIILTIISMMKGQEKAY